MKHIHSMLLPLVLSLLSLSSSLSLSSRRQAVALLMLATSAITRAMSTSSGKRGALIFLHGLGDTPAGWSQLQFSLPQEKPRLKDIEFVFPPAPTIPISINGGQTMPGWFDLFDWPIAVGSKDDKAGLDRSVKQIEAEVEKLKAKGIPASKIVVAGFSQGGAAALLAAYRNQGEPYAGCACLSGWLTLPSELDVPQTAKATNLFWGHGSYDDKVLFEQQKFGVDKLREAGVEVDDRAYDMGHMSHPDETERLAEFVDEKLFVTTEAKQEL